jgi:hypothetical protein
MCLTPDINKTMKMLKGRKKQFIFFKVLRKEKPRDRPSVYKTPIHAVAVANKKFASNRRKRYLTEEEMWDGMVSEGIHVFVSKRRAKYFLEDWPEDCEIFKCICLLEDLIAFGKHRGDAVFTKIELIDFPVKKTKVAKG